MRWWWRLIRSSLDVGVEDDLDLGLHRVPARSARSRGPRPSGSRTPEVRAPVRAGVAAGDLGGGVRRGLAERRQRCGAGQDVRPRAELLGDSSAGRSGTREAQDAGGRAVGVVQIAGVFRSTTKRCAGRRPPVQRDVDPAFLAGCMSRVQESTRRRGTGSSAASPDRAARRSTAPPVESTSTPSRPAPGRRARPSPTSVVSGNVPDETSTAGRVSVDDAVDGRGQGQVRRVVVDDAQDRGIGSRQRMPHPGRSDPAPAPAASIRCARQ